MGRRAGISLFIALAAVLGLGGCGFDEYSAALVSPTPPEAATTLVWSVSQAKDVSKRDLSSVTLSGCWTASQVSSVTATGVGGVRLPALVHTTGRRVSQITVWQLRDELLPVEIAVTFTSSLGSVESGTSIWLKTGVLTERLDVGGPTCAQTFALALSSNEGGSVSASPPGPTYAAGTVVEITATPSAGFEFVGWTVDGAPAGASNPIEVTMERDHSVAATFAELAPPLPPDPSTVAPPIDSTVATDLLTESAFLFSGPTPIQSGVAPGTIDLLRVAVLRGLVVDRSGVALPGVTIAILGHPELGQTLSREDGRFDLAVNGGGPLTVAYAKSGFLEAQRQVEAPWQQFTAVPEVTLLPLDATVTEIALPAATAQVARGSTATDGDGARTATLVFPAGVQATMTLPGGLQQPLSVLHVRATEMTVGEGGPQSMPAELPPTSGYTYAVDFTVDEAQSAGATSVDFDQAVPFYVENFVGMPVGLAVPVGFYDRRLGAWVPSDDGRVLAILGVAAGRAQLDVDGSGTPATAVQLGELGITDEELVTLASLFPTGQSLWRARISHFTPYDLNYGISPLPGSVEPVIDRPLDLQQRPISDSCAYAGGSSIECQNQLFGESVPVVGTPYALAYRSDRVAGNQAPYTLHLPLSGATVPSPLKRIDLEISIAGQLVRQSFAPAPDLSYTFVWDGLDAYGRRLQGAQRASVRVDYVYDGVYNYPPSFPRSFALSSGVPIAGDIPAREAIRLSQRKDFLLGAWDVRGEGLGGWSLSVHHSYDPTSRTVYLGSGERIRGLGEVTPGRITTVAGTGAPGFNGDEIPATEASLNQPFGMTVGPDGSLYIADGGNNRLRKVGSDGIIRTVAGNGLAGWSGDGGPATEAALFGPTGVAVGPEGSLYIADQLNNRVRRVDPAGTITTLAGNGLPGFGGDGGPAIYASVNGVSDLDVGPDGSVYLTDDQNARIRKVSPDGVIATVAGDGSLGYSGDGGPATEASINFPTNVSIGRDGSIYLSDGTAHVIRRVTPEGIIHTVAGSGSAGFAGDGGPATDALLNVPEDVFAEPDGTLLIADAGNHRVRQVSPDGIITTIAGNGNGGYSGDGGAPLQAEMQTPLEVALGPDGSIFIEDGDRPCVRRISQQIPGFNLTDVLIPSPDGAEVYVFDGRGRHLRTLQALTGSVLYEFAYDAAGRLAQVTEKTGGTDNLTEVLRDSSGRPTGVRSPYGQLTSFTLDANGHLATIANPAGETLHFTYSADGLIQQQTDARGNSWSLEYDEEGRLSLESDPLGGSQSLVHTTTEDGFEVTRTSAMGRTTLYSVALLPSGVERRTNTFPDGTQSTSERGPDGSFELVVPDQTTTLRLDVADPRWGPIVTLPQLQTITTPGGVVEQVVTTRSTLLSDPDDPLSIVSQSDTAWKNGALLVSEYDAASRGFTVTSPEGRVTTARIDALGRVVATGTSGMLEVGYGYDDRGRPTGLSQGTRATTFGYDALGQMASITDTLGRTTGFAHDAAGRIIAMTLPSGATVAYGYDESGNLTSVTPPGRPAHGLQYTERDELAAYQPPPVAGTGPTSYAYDLDGKLTQISRPDGRAVATDYDSAGHMSAMSFNRGTLSFGYSPTTGQLVSIEAPDGVQLALSHDGPLPSGETWSGPVAGSVTRTFDASFRLASEAVDGAGVVSFAYDGDDELVSAGALALERSPLNALLVGTSLGGVSDTRSYDPYGDLVGYLAAFGGSPLFSRTVTRDPAGRISQDQEELAGEAHSYEYAYDADGRLVTVQRDGAEVEHYTYDANGNRLTAMLGAQVTPYTYDAQDRLEQAGAVQFSYTANGELLSRTEAGQTTTYEYDDLGNLVAALLPDGHAVTYAIDGRNRRIGKRVDGVLVRGWLYGEAQGPVAELDGSGAVTSRFIYASRRDVPDYLVKAGETYRILSGDNGSPRLVVNAATGAIAQRLDYDAFGNVLVDTAPGFQPFGFAGGLYDADLGLVRFGVRDYDPRTGRWTAKDPILFAGFDPNLYQYVLADPVNLRDGSGLQTKACGNDDFDRWAEQRRKIAYAWTDFIGWLAGKLKVPAAQNNLEKWGERTNQPVLSLCNPINFVTTALKRLGIDTWVDSAKKFHDATKHLETSPTYTYEAGAFHYNPPQQSQTEYYNPTTGP